MIATKTQYHISAALLSLGAVLIANTALAHPRGHGTAENTETAETSDATPDPMDLVRLQAKLDEKPEDEARAVAFARYAARRARRLGDTTLLRRAGNALSPWRDDPLAPTEILIIRANIKQIDHRFDDALTDLNTVLARQPANPQALLSRAFIRATTGAAKSGRNDCAALPRTISIGVRETCRARLTSLTGELKTAYRRMLAVLAIIPATRSDERSFALSVAAEIAERFGDSESADRYYSELMAIDANSAFARAAYADFLLGQDRPKAAARVIGDAPHTEALLLLRALSGKSSADAASQTAARTLSARLAADGLNGNYSHAREYARFALDYLDDQDAAFRYARENWRVQKEPIDARILARTAIAVDKPSVLDELAQWRRSTGLEDEILSTILRNQNGQGTENSIATLPPTQP